MNNGVTETVQLNPSQHPAMHRYILRTNSFTSVAEGLLLEWSPGGNARIKWTTSNCPYWILKDELPMVIEDLGRHDRVTLREPK